MTALTTEKATTIRGYRYLVLAAALMMYLLIVMGGVVRGTGSGLSCPGWPMCYGQIVPPSDLHAILQYTHQSIASFTLLLVLAAAVVAWLRYRSMRWISRPLALAFGLLVLEIVLGALTVKTELSPGVVAVHLGVALTVLALTLTSGVATLSRHANPALSDQLSFRSPFAKLTLWTLAATFIVLVSGTLVRNSEATTACIGWPLCNGQLLPATVNGWINMTHRIIVGLAFILVAWMFIQAWRTQRTPGAILPAATVATVLFFAQSFVGALKTVTGFPVFLLALHEATAAAVWAALVVLVMVTGLAARTAEQEQVEAKIKVAAGQRARDLLTTTRPIVVLLLLVTAYAGMVVGAKAFPPLALTFWTLLGGALSAGGAQAINQYVDRDIDQLMQRTAKRPIPAGRMTPAEGLAWGLALCIASLYIVAVFVNWLAALWVLAGILYYVVWYTLILKRTSAQNIVIGGGAGALPPLVGWAAATGRLDIPALFLFAIIFFWTPPHFWALALVRLKDYARAGVPMLPVVRGDEFTRGQIMRYTVGLVVVTLLLPALGMAGVIYGVSALALGGWLFHAAWKVWKQGGNKLAWTMYRTSSMYLAFLFLALMADALIRTPRL